MTTPPSALLRSLPTAALAAFCERWLITELALFGSVLRPDFRPDSDVDFLVTFAPDAPWSLVDHVTMTDELETLLDRPVDVLTRRGVERSKNWIRRKHVLESAQVIDLAQLDPLLFSKET